MIHVNHGEAYTIIRAGIKGILENGADMTSADFVRLRNRVRYYCENNDVRCQMLYDGIGEVLRGHITRLTQIGRSIVGSDLIKYYIREWTSFKFSATLVANTCYFLNTSWIRPRRHQLNIDLPGIRKLSCITWRMIMVEAFGRDLSNSVSSLLNLERMGHTNDNKSIREYVDALVELGLLVVVEPGELYLGPQFNYSVYISNFEVHLLDLKLKLYRKDSVEYFLCHSVMDYVQYAENIIMTEEVVASKYLQPMTVSKQVEICTQEYIVRRHAVLSCEYFTQSLHRNIIQMGQLYMLSKRLQTGFADNFVEFLKGDIERIQSVIIAKYKKAIKAGRQLGPRDYVSVIFNTYKKYADADNVVTRHRQFGEWFYSFVNNNYIVRLVGASLTLRTSASILAVYCDMEMRRSTTTLSSIGSNAFVQRVMIVYHYLRDKDQFLRNHRALLARRLATRSSIINVEILLIEELVRVCGYQITYKIRKLISEYYVSKEIEHDYSRFLAGNNGKGVVPYEFNISVFSSVAWPGSESYNSISLPPELTNSMDRFTGFYSQVHSGRKLEWLHDVSSVEVTTNCFGKKYTLYTSPIHVAVLFMFNDRISNTIREITNHTKIPTVVVIHAVCSLLKIGILLFNGRESDMNSESLVQLNSSFNNKNRIIKIKTHFTAILPQEQNPIATANENVTRATIVRFMKTRPLLFVSQTDLFSLVSVQLSQNQLKLEKVMFKKCLEDLIYQDYIERTGERAYLYKYKP